MRDEIIINSNSKLSYKVTGSGPEYIVCLHGFGEDASLFDQVYTKYPNHTIISFDLPFHGDSDVPHDHVRPSHWNEAIAVLTEKYDIQDFHLISFSLGGRFLIRSVCDHPERIKSCQVIASDGFHYTYWYRFAVSAIGNPIFKHQMKNPDMFFRLCDFLDRYNLINPSMTKFARLQLKSKSQRIKVYNSWTYLKHLRTPIEEFASTVQKHDIPVNVYVGSKDNIIKESFFDKFIELTDSKKHVIKARHHEMVGEWLKLEH